MLLKYTCSSCKTSNSFKPNKATRGELQMEVGDIVKVNCQHCGKLENIHLNRVYAVVDNRIVLGTLGLILVASFFLSSLIGIYVVITAMAPIMAWVYENRAAHSFNSYKIRRK